mmetsp:Transcript_10509/g.17472  ORF Transcript_10509/g.17472 Transcript_10509/m.17472 type:complete len:693 (-) Transcript_10509:35-2113(-)
MSRYLIMRELILPLACFAWTDFAGRVRPERGQTLDRSREHRNKSRIRKWPVMDWKTLASLLVAFNPAALGPGRGHKAQELTHRLVVQRQEIAMLARKKALKAFDFMGHKESLVLFRDTDLRLHDNPALLTAARAGPVIPVFIWSRDEEGRWGIRGASEVYLKQALLALEASFEKLGSKLILRRCGGKQGSKRRGKGGDKASFEAEVLALVRETGVDTVHYTKGHTPEAQARDVALEAALAGQGVTAVSHQSQLLYDPDSVALAGGFQGGHWGTLMPFLRSCTKSAPVPECLASPKSWELAMPARVLPISCGVEGLGLALMPKKKKRKPSAKNHVNDWGAPIRARWQAGEAAAKKACRRFVAAGLQQYEKDRSRADIESSTSQLSMHLRFGELSPRYLYHAIRAAQLPYDVTKTFARRLHWRDLAYYHLKCFPEMRTKGIRRHYDETRWVEPEDEYKRRLRAWQRGMTGYPMVDAGMRELYLTGWMPQTVRMICASFLVEYLRVSWVDGEDWFHDTLCDADSAINAMMWQNAGRSGIDQWNFVLSPEAASQDPTGEYTRKYVPELAALPKQFLHKPWLASAKVLSSAGVTLGENYPERIISDLSAERHESVEAVLEMRRANQKHNDERGYDTVVLPDSSVTKVFTKEEYRIDASGRVRPPPRRRNSGSQRQRNSASPQGSRHQSRRPTLQKKR